jgi:hypothetical protein
VDAELATPLPVLEDLTKLAGHSGPCAVASGIAQLPSQVDHKRQHAVDNAASRVATRMENIVVGAEEGM